MKKTVKITASSAMIFITAVMGYIPIEILKNSSLRGQPLPFRRFIGSTEKYTVGISVIAEFKKFLLCLSIISPGKSTAQRLTEIYSLMITKGGGNICIEIFTYIFAVHQYGISLNRSGKGGCAVALKGDTS